MIKIIPCTKIELWVDKRRQKKIRPELLKKFKVQEILPHHHHRFNWHWSCNFHIKLLVFMKIFPGNHFQLNFNLKNWNDSWKINGTFKSFINHSDVKKKERKIQQKTFFIFISFMSFDWHSKTSRNVSNSFATYF